MRGKGKAAEAHSGGYFREWLIATDRNLREGSGAEVPCGDCTACCRAGQFIHVGIDEVEALAAIPRQLLFPAPGTSSFLLLGHDHRGHCPMLRDEGCSIYEVRPKACRSYDCRIFPATGVEPPDTHGEVALAAGSWKFQYADQAEQSLHAAAIRAARFIEAHRDEILPGAAANEIQLALAALKCAQLFTAAETPSAAAVAAAMSTNPKTPQEAT